MVLDSPAARRVALPRWLDIRLAIGVALVLGSVLIGARTMAAADHTVPMLAASQDLAAGTVLTAADLTTVRVRLPQSAPYVDALSRAVGRQLSRPVGRGELVPAASLTSGAALTTVTVALSSGESPSLRAGQRIELWLSTKQCASVVLLLDATVQDAVRSGTTFTSGDGQNITLSLPPALADRVVQALSFDAAVVRAGVLTGAPSTAGALPDLSGCATPTGSG